MIFMKVHEDKNGFISPLIYKLLRIFARKSGLGNGLMSHFGVLELNHSSNNMIFCLHGFVRVSKNRVCGGLPVLNLKSVNLQYITLGCLDDGTNKSSTKSDVPSIIFFYTFYRLRALNTLYFNFFNFIKK